MSPQDSQVLVPKLGNLRGGADLEPTGTQRAGRDPRRGQIPPPPRWVAGSMSEGTYLREACLESLNGFHKGSISDGLVNTALSQGCVLENGSGCGGGGRNQHAKDGAGGEGPPSSRVNLLSRPLDDLLQPQVAAPAPPP